MFPTKAMSLWMVNALVSVQKQKSVTLLNLIENVILLPSVFYSVEGTDYPQFVRLDAPFPYWFSFIFMVIYIVDSH